MVWIRSVVGTGVTVATYLVLLEGACALVPCLGLRQEGGGKAHPITHMRCASPAFPVVHGPSRQCGRQHAPAALMCSTAPAPPCPARAAQACVHACTHVSMCVRVCVQAAQLKSILRMANESELGTRFQLIDRAQALVAAAKGGEAGEGAAAKGGQQAESEESMVDVSGVRERGHSTSTKCFTANCLPLPICMELQVWSRATSPLPRLGRACLCLTGSTPEGQPLALADPIPDPIPSHPTCTGGVLGHP